MRLTEFMIVLIASLLFLVPIMQKEQRSERREAQEETKREEISDEGEVHTYKIRYETRTEEEEKIADILWMKKAAQIARDSGMPYFNVLKQRMKRTSTGKPKVVVEGVIELDNDPMEAEYDANELPELPYLSGE